MNGLQNPGTTVSMYCVRCRSKKEVLFFERVMMKNGKPAVKAACPTCGQGMYKIGSAPETTPVDLQEALSPQEQRLLMLERALALV